MEQNSHKKNSEQCAAKRLSKDDVKHILSKKDKIVKSGKIVTK